MFSVVIPLYNKSLYIEKTIRSVLDQTFRNFEIIVVNDGSTDDGPEKVLKIIHDLEPQTTNPEPRTPNPKIRLINQSNSGVSVARNNGFKVAHYDYISFLDADDWWDKNYLMEMTKLIKNFPEAALYGTNYYEVKFGRKKVANIGVNINFQAGYIDYFTVYSKTFWMPITSSSSIIDKKTFEYNGGFNSALKFGEDFDLWARLALHSKIAFCNKPLVFINQDIPPSNRALGDSKLYKKDAFFIFNLSHFEDFENDNPYLKKLLDGLRVRTLQRYYFLGEYPREVKLILSQVDFKEQPLYYLFIYKSPKVVVKLFMITRIALSRFKSGLLNFYWNRTNYSPLQISRRKDFNQNFK